MQSQLSRYAKRVQRLLTSLSDGEADNKSDNKSNKLVIKDIVLDRHVVILKFETSRRATLTGITSDLACIVSREHNCNELSVKVRLTGLPSIVNMKVNYDDNSHDRIDNYRIDYEALLQSTRRPHIYRQMSRPFQKRITFLIKSHVFCKSFDFSRLLDSPLVMAANCSIDSNKLTIYYNNFTDLMLFIKWLNISLAKNLILYESKRNVESIKTLFRKEIAFASQIELNANSSYHSIRKELFGLEMTTDARITRMSDL